ncbi:MAG: OsmC family protein [Thermotogota bacterium]|nr:OsmC family protein [Thermotogota bacterium]
MSDAKFRIRATSENATKTKVKARNFEMILDEPDQFGGTNEGATPVEYVLASLAGCLNVVGHMVAKELDFEIRDLSFDISGPLNADKAFGKDTKDRAGYKNIDVTIKIDADADEDILNKWVEMVESRCPVSDNLHNKTPLNISLKTIVEAE